MKAAAILEVSETKAIIEELEQQGNDLVADVCRVMAVCLLRVSDAINLRYSDFERGTLKIVEQKTGKKKEIENLPASILAMVANRRAAYPKDTFIFAGKGNRCKKDTPVSRVYVSTSIKKVATKLGIEGTISAHSFRKYGATQVLEKTKDLAQVSDLLNHTNFQSTKAYLKLSAKSAGVAVSHIEI